MGRVKKTNGIFHIWVWSSQPTLYYWKKTCCYWAYVRHVFFDPSLCLMQKIDFQCRNFRRRWLCPPVHTFSNQRVAIKTERFYFRCNKLKTKSAHLILRIMSNIIPIVLKGLINSILILAYFDTDRHSEFSNWHLTCFCENFLSLISKVPTP